MTCNGCALIAVVPHDLDCGEDDLTWEKAESTIAVGWNKEKD